MTTTRRIFHVSRPTLWTRFAPVALCLLGTMLAGCAAFQPETPTVVQQPWEPAPGWAGLRLQTAHYDIHTTARDGLTLEYLPAFLESAFAGYQALLPLPEPPSRRLPVYLFESRAQWAAFTRQLVPHLAPLYLRIQQGGYMDPGSGAVVAWDLGRDHTLALLGHEGLHQYLSAFFSSPVPAWLNEGLATQWESFDLRGRRPRFTPRENYLRRNSLREAVAREEAWIPLRELVSMNAGDAVLRAGQIKRSFYAQVWVLVLFLREGAPGPWRDGFRDLLADVAADRLRTTLHAYRTVDAEARGISDGEAAFRRYITDDLDAADRACKAFAVALVH